MDGGPNPDMHQQQQQQAGFAPRRQYEQMPANVGPVPVSMPNGQGQVGPVPAAPTKILQRPAKVKKEKVDDLIASTSKMAIEESLKLVSISNKRTNLC